VNHGLADVNQLNLFEPACSALHNPVELGAEAVRTEPHEKQQNLVIAENCEELLNCTYVKRAECEVM
jgi:hypothetical protein